MPKSAGLIIFRRTAGLEVLLLHMGGPFWARKDGGAWTIPKGEYEEEDPLTAARRECREETGLSPDGEFIQMSPMRTSNGKTIYAWAVEFNCDPTLIQSNTFEMEWPAGSGKMKVFPEVDRAQWFPVEQARGKLAKSQRPLLDELAGKLSR